MKSLLQYLDARIRIWYKKKHKHETWLNPALFKLVLVVWGIIIIIILHISGPLVTTEYHLNYTAYPSAAAEHVHPFIT